MHQAEQSSDSGKQTWLSDYVLVKFVKISTTRIQHSKMLTKLNNNEQELNFLAEK